MPDLQEFNQEYKDQALLLGIDLGQFFGLGNLEDAKNLLKELEVTYPCLLYTSPSPRDRG